MVILQCDLYLQNIKEIKEVVNCMDPLIRMEESRKFCLFELRLNVPVNDFSVMSGRSHRFLGN